MKRNRAKDWLSEAQSTLQYARAALRDAFYAQVCFNCQQAAEKAVKSVLYAKGAKVILSHSLRALCQELQWNDTLLDSAKLLDQYYITARYPDALVEGTPHESFGQTQAKEAIVHAETFLKLAENAQKK